MFPDAYQLPNCAETDTKSYVAMMIGYMEMRNNAVEDDNTALSDH